MPYTLGNKLFRTKKAIIQYFQTYHNSHEVGTILTGEHHAVMFDLIKMHPLYDEWASVTKFRICKDLYNMMYYQSHSESGWQTFSYLKCIRNHSKAKNTRFNVINAGRRAIQRQIDEYRFENVVDDMFWKCAKCNEFFTSVDIDHNYEIITFQTLLDNFISEYNKHYDDFNLINSCDGHIFNDEDKQLWNDYHRTNAVLRCLCRTCHQKKTSVITST